MEDRENVEKKEEDKEEGDNEENVEKGKSQE